MRPTRIAGVVVAVLVLAVAASSAQAAAKVRKHKKEHAIAGVVKVVEKDKTKDAGKITVQVGGHHHHKKGGGVATTTVEKPAVEKTIRVTADTKFTKVSGKKDAKEKTAATFADLKDGDHVVIAAMGDKAEAVNFRVAHHHKKGKKKVAA